MIGQQEPLKLLLNQRDPAEAGRVLVYYQYFGRARASQIAAIDAHLADLARLDAELAAEEERLAALEERQQGELSRLQSGRERRGRALVTLESESKNRARELERLKEQQGGLEKLVRELRRALERLDRFPSDSKDAFAKLKGRLAWPVAGRLVASFGQTRAGGVKWDGMLVTGTQGAPVRAIYHGRVVYADWLSGLGLLTIIDHGDGYLSLYGHNERLYKEVGERVTAGDTIATLGDSGGRPRAELYFEIRKAGRPIDPRPWFKTAAP
jgi:septal ring factor EnvC (AmiA/AmiB activator)